MRDFDGLRGLGGRGCRGGVRGVAIQRTSGCRGRVRGQRRKYAEGCADTWGGNSGPRPRPAGRWHGGQCQATAISQRRHRLSTVRVSHGRSSARRRRGCRGPAAGHAGPALAAGYFGPAACSAGPRPLRGRPDLDGREAGPAILPARLADAPGLARRRGKVAESRSLARFAASRNP